MLDHLNARYPIPDDEFLILGDLTRTTSYGWVFFFNSRRFVETRDVLYALGGNGPVVFERDTAAIVELPSHSPPDEVLLQYEAKRSRLA